MNPRVPLSSPPTSHVFGVRAISQEALTAHVAEITRRTAPFRVSFSTPEIHDDSIGGGYKLFLMTDEGLTLYRRSTE